MERDPFDLIGDVLDGQFRVDAFAGEGDLSVVYRGHHLGLDAPVAIKCLDLPATLDPALVRPLEDGFKAAGRVHYRLARGNLNIAQSIGSGATIAPRTGGSVPYLVREWFDGESLASDLARRREEKRRGRPIDEAIALLEPAFDGFAFAHAQGEVHLSINPSNLFLARRRDGQGCALKVLDFGVAQTMNDFASGVGSPGGLRVLFPAYAAPEQLDKKLGEQGPWTDVYALALLTMEVLSDRVVMSEVDTGALVDHALDAARRPTPKAHGLRLPHALEQALTRAVSLVPAQRQKSAADLWRDIRQGVVPQDPVAPPAMPPAVAPRVEVPASPSSAFSIAVDSARPPRPAWLEVAALEVAAWAKQPWRRRPRAVRLGVVAGVVLSAAALLLVVVTAFSVPPHPLAFAATLAAKTPPSPPVPASAPGETVPPEALGPFSPSTAWRALYVTSRQVSRCRRGRVWGGTTATVTFDGDGSVGKVSFRGPFRGSPTAACVTDVLGSAHVAPFAGKTGVVDFWFYVSQK